MKKIYSMLAVLTALFFITAASTALAESSSSKNAKDEGLDEIAPSIGKGEEAAGILDKLSKGIGKIISSVMPAAPGAEETADAAGETAKAGAKTVKDYRTRGDAVISDSGDLKVWNEETGKWEDF